MVVEDEPKLRVQPSNTLGEYHKIPPAPNVSSVITDAWLMLLVADAALPSSVYTHTTVDLRRIRPLFWKKIKPEILVYFPVCSSRLEFFFPAAASVFTPTSRKSARL